MLTVSLYIKVFIILHRPTLSTLSVRVPSLVSLLLDRSCKQLRGVVLFPE
jgi:hypothetical protein